MAALCLSYLSQSAIFCVAGVAAGEFQHHGELPGAVEDGAEEERHGEAVEVQQGAVPARALLPQHRGQDQRLQHRQAPAPGRHQGQPQELRDDQQLGSATSAQL